MIVGPAIQLLLDGHHLSREDAHEIMGSIMDGEATEAQIAGFLVALRTKGETADEIAGFAEAMREHVVPVTPQRFPVVDIVGTGGDGAHTFNISTAAALVAAAAGAAVAKHGNRAASSQAGSADVLEELGIALEQQLDRGPDDHWRKFLAMAGPSGVSTLSGWNCTPSIGSSRWRTPITSPSAVWEVTTSPSGTSVAASE